MERSELVSRLRTVQHELDLLRLGSAGILGTDAEAGMVEAYLLTAYDCVSAAAGTAAEATLPAKEVAK